MKPKTFSFRQVVMEEMLNRHRDGTTSRESLKPAAIPRNIAKTPKPEKEDLISKHKSRFLMTS